MYNSQDLLARYNKSGLSVRAYADKMGIKYNTLRGAIGRAKRNGEKKKPEPLPLPPTNVERQEPVRPKANPVLLKAAIFDIETTGFRAEGYKGDLVLVGILPLDADEVKIIPIRFEDKPEDRYVLLAVLRELWKYDILIHQNGAEFDLNFLNTRRMWHGMPSLRTWIYFDTYQTAKNIAPKIGKSLECLGYHFQSDGIKTKIGQKLPDFYCPYRKTFKKFMDELSFHCAEDVKMTRDIFYPLFAEALTLGTPQLKTTKWRRGIPSIEAWTQEYELSIAQSKRQKRKNGNGRKEAKKA